MPIPFFLFCQGHLLMMGPFYDFHDLLNTFLKSPGHPDTNDSIDACDDVLTPVFLLHFIL